MEWAGPAGQVAACGGDALIRLEAFRQVSGYNDGLIAGEEPEMCVRLRANEWTIRRIDADMTWHDANMTTWRQWWKRAVRAGHAYAEGHAMHGRRLERFRRSEVRSILFWALLFPTVALVGAWPTCGLSISLLCVAYIRLLRRVRHGRIQRGDSTANATLYAQSCVIGKFAQLWGMAKYWRNRLRKRQSVIIEYK